MAFDGITVAAIVYELNGLLKDGRIVKITQPEKDEIMLTIKGNSGQQKLFISGSASLPLVYITEDNKPSPMTAPAFCMLLRKHLQGGRVIEVKQPGLERIIDIYIEHLDEMGDLCQRILTVELMGKYSNIILRDSENNILDSLKHVSAFVSSVREVLPGREYFIPNTCDKYNPLDAQEKAFIDIIRSMPTTCGKAIYTHFTGISPFMASEMCFEAGIDSDFVVTELSDDNCSRLYRAFESHIRMIKDGDFKPILLYENGKPRDYAVTKAPSYVKDVTKEFESVSSLLVSFYSEKNASDNMRVKSGDLRKLVGTILERDVKKLDLQLKQLNDSKDCDKYKLYGELLNAYGYSIKEGEKSAKLLNYYTNEEITVPLDEHKSVSENARKYYDKYNKMKRTGIALLEQTKEVKREIEYLEGVKTYIEISTSENELSEIKSELVALGFVKKNSGKKDKKSKIKITTYKFGDYTFYVGKNNIQNEEVSFKIATGNDWWFHAKNVPGAHVVVKSDKDNPATEWDMPDEVFEAAARVAAHFSKNASLDKTEVDYTRKKHLKKTPGGAAGFVIYHTNYSMTIGTDIGSLPLTSLD